MSGITDFLKKDISFKGKPSRKAQAETPKPESEAPTAEAQAPKPEDAPKSKNKKASRKPNLSLKRNVSLKPKRAPKPEGAPKPKRSAKPKLPAKPKMSLSLPKPSRKPRRSSSSSAGRHKQIVGLKIGSSQLAAAVVVNNGSPKLLKAARHTLPPDVVAGGEVRDAAALAQEIEAFFQAADLPRKNVRLGIGSSRTGVRVFERPPVDDQKQLANAIRFRAHETLPIPIEEAMLDYHVVEDANVAPRVLLAVAYRDLVDRFAATCAAAKVELLGIDLEAFALLRAVGGDPLTAGEREEAARVAVSIGHDRTTVAVSDGRLCEFTRVLEWGGGRVTAAIEQALEVDAAEAERIKRSLDISGGSPQDPADERTARAADAARREVHGLARELASSLHFYQDQPDSLGFAEITITGGGAHLQGLAEQLEELIGISVRVADPFARVGSGHGISSGGQDGSLAVAIGLGIED